MNKEQAAERLCAIESEVEKLRRIIDEPEQRMPESGDVWIQTGDEAPSILDSSGGYLYDPRLNCLAGATWNRCRGEAATYLGKFDEVFVKISDVREALSIKDDRSRNVIEWLADDRFKPRNQTIIETHSALRKLNIITD